MPVESVKIQTHPDLVNGSSRGTLFANQSMLQIIRRISQDNLRCFVVALFASPGALHDPQPDPPPPLSGRGPE